MQENIIGVKVPHGMGNECADFQLKSLSRWLHYMLTLG